MHFMSDTAPITLYNDISDYGVGDYLFQTLDGKDQPVAFVSRSLHKSRLRWAVIQKEAYGIFYSRMYLQSQSQSQSSSLYYRKRSQEFIIYR